MPTLSGLEKGIYRKEVNNNPAPQEKLKQILNTLILQEKNLLGAMELAYNNPTNLSAGDIALVNFKIEDGIRKFEKSEFSQNNFQTLIENYRMDPKTGCAAIRNNFFNILKDNRLTDGENQGRLKRYLKIYSQLITKIDSLAFPPDANSDTVHEGVPEYIPDGLSDMGNDKEIKEQNRGREKIRVEKSTIYKKLEDDIYNIIQKVSTKLSNQPINNDSTDVLKKELFESILEVIIDKIKYDHRNLGYHQAQMNRSIRIDEYLDEGKGVCRHMAMIFQLLAQYLGLTSRLLKCDLYVGEIRIGRHAANLIRVNGKWFVVDVTNSSHDAKYIYQIEMSKNDPLEKVLYPNAKIPLVDKKGLGFVARTDMYYRIVES